MKNHTFVWFTVTSVWFMVWDVTYGKDEPKYIL